MEENLTAALLASSTVQAALGNRLNWGRVPQSLKVRPYAILQHISNVAHYTMAGVVDYQQTRVQIDVYADTYQDARGAARAIEGLLSGLRNAQFLGIFSDGNQDLIDVDESDNTPLFRVSSDYIIHHRLS